VSGGIAFNLTFPSRWQLLGVVEERGSWMLSKRAVNRYYWQAQLMDIVEECSYGECMTRARMCSSAVLIDKQHVGSGGGSGPLSAMSLYYDQSSLTASIKNMESRT
jgi:hypothetical protein